MRININFDIELDHNVLRVIYRRM